MLVHSSFGYNAGCPRHSNSKYRLIWVSLPHISFLCPLGWIQRNNTIISAYQFPGSQPCYVFKIFLPSVQPSIHNIPYSFFDQTMKVKSIKFIHDQTALCRLESPINRLWIVMFRLHDFVFWSLETFCSWGPIYDCPALALSCIYVMLWSL